MNKQLVFIHGRAQQKMDPATLKSDWIKALTKGLAQSNLQFPISETDIHYPYYGDALFEMAEGTPVDKAPETIIKGDGLDANERAFILAVLNEVLEEKGITDDSGIKEKGVLNWGWVQTVLRTIDRGFSPGSAASIAMATHDVYQYLYNSNIRQSINKGVSKALSQGTETVVVSHSLGTVVAYNILSEFGQQNGWKVPLLVTVGSPLAVTAIKDACAQKYGLQCPPCVSAWYNAMDTRDVVPLYPLDSTNFPLDPDKPAITNNTNVDNFTENRHGIAGYLGDKEVARHIYDALQA